MKFIFITLNQASSATRGGLVAEKPGRRLIIRDVPGPSISPCLGPTMAPRNAAQVPLRLTLSSGTCRHGGKHRRGFRRQRTTVRER